MKNGTFTLDVFLLVVVGGRDVQVPEYFIHSGGMFRPLIQVEDQLRHFPDLLSDHFGELKTDLLFIALDMFEQILFIAVGDEAQVHLGHAQIGTHGDPGDRYDVVGEKAFTVSLKDAPQFLLY